MAYQSLYRRYRPRRFAEVLGQEPVVRALRNAVRDNRIGHAYLFSGPRGTGKTSTARILAKALNCTNPQAGEPDCECESCLAMEAGRSYDLQELDAASNSGVEAMRTLIDRVALGSPGRTKVYILDEVHMLTPAASNALLKTLEEPPPHVVFVLATTDPHKVLPTIRSRTQHFEFHLLPADVLEEHVRWVVHDAELQIDDVAIGQVLRAGGGSARDTLSALDRIVAGGADERGESVDHLIDALAETDTALALQAVADAVSAGRDPRVLGEELLGRLRDVFLQRMGGQLPHLTATDREQVEAMAGRFTDRETTRALEQVGEALLEMRQAPDARIPLEVALVRLTRADADSSLESLVSRIEQLERTVAGGAAPGGAQGPAPGTAPDAGAAERSKGASPADQARAQLNARTASAGDPPPPPLPLPPPTPPRQARGAPAPAAGSAGDPQPTSTAPSQGRPAAEDAAVASAPGPNPEPPAADAEPTTPRPGQEQAERRPSRPDESSSATGSTPSPAATTTDGEPKGVDLATVRSAWTDAVLPKLSGLTKAMFTAGQVADVDHGTVVVSLPNEPHRARCATKVDLLGAALAEHFGHAIPVRLVVGDGPKQESLLDPARPSGGERGSKEAPSSPRGTAPADAAADADDEPFDHHDLETATDQPADGVSRLTEAFPGAELLDGD